MTWCVEIIGDFDVLNMLTESMSGHTTSITVESDKFLMRSNTFDNLGTAAEVAEKAEDILSTLSGSIQIISSIHTSMAIGCIYRLQDRGLPHVFIVPEPAVVILDTLPPTVVTTASDGTKTIHRPADPIPQWLELAFTDDAVAKILRLRNQDSLGWVELYRIYEVIDADVVANGWASNGDIKLFKRTANSVNAVGDDARHGKETTTPPKKPMTLSKAKAMIDVILKRWLSNKVGML